MSALLQLAGFLGASWVVSLLVERCYRYDDDTTGRARVPLTGDRAARS